MPIQTQVLLDSCHFQLRRTQTSAPNTMTPPGNAPSSSH